MREKKEEKSSQIVWKGFKVTGSHQETLDLKSGSLSFENEQFVGGEFVSDMSSLIYTDLSREFKDKLEGHIKSCKLVDVVEFPTANLNFTKVMSSGKNYYNINTDLTIKGITQPILFDV